jgi:predicted RNA-binding protein with RPS1 domain
MSNDTDRDLTVTGEEQSTAIQTQDDAPQTTDAGPQVADTVDEAAPSETPEVVASVEQDADTESPDVISPVEQDVPSETPEVVTSVEQDADPAQDDAAVESGEEDVAVAAVESAPAEPAVEAAAEEVAVETPEESTKTVDEKPSRPRPRGDRPAISAPKSIGDIPDDMTADDFAAAVEQTVFEFKEGDIVAGTVVRVDPDEVLVDIGYKSEGVIPSHELSVRNNANPDDVVKVGDDIEALVLQMEDDEGRLVLSKKRAQYERAWGRIEGVMNDGGTVTGHVIEVVKGGLIVDIGLRGFLPASLVDLRRVRDLQPFVGEPIEAKVIELDRNRNNVVLSRRAYLEEEQAEQRQAFLTDLKEGDVRPGVVSSVVNFGAFVDLGGMDGLVHVSELSWRHVNHPGEIVTVGDQVKVKVLEVDYDRERISLSIRQTAEDPWEMFARGTEVGSVVPGKVTKTVPFGAFVSVGEGVEGLVHVSEIAMGSS